MQKFIKNKIRNKFLISLLIAGRNKLYFWISKRKWRELKQREFIKLELGSGKKSGSNGWVTVDLNGADICHDLKNGLPIDSNSVDKIYTSHLFEHISYQDLSLLIQECYRVLKIGGELLVSVPNAGLYIQCYVAKKEFRNMSEAHKPAVINTGSLIDQVNYIAYMGGEHKYMFDEENLVNTLKQSYFSKVCLREFDSELDVEERKFESIYASAVK